MASGAGYEIIDGKVFEVPPSHEPHADRNSKLAALLEAHVTADFNAAVDMLTRTAPLTNFAPDASVYPAARDPETGGRQLEHLAFEVVNTETLGHAATKATLLVERGVRRVFALDVEGQRVLEWSSKKGAWRNLKAGSAIADPCFVVPLPVDALCLAAKADDAVAAALLAKKNPVLVSALQQAETHGLAKGKAEGLREGEARGMRSGKIEALLLLLGSRGLQISKAQAEQIRACTDLAQLDGWLQAALTAESVAALLGSPRPRRPRRP